MKKSLTVLFTALFAVLAISFSAIQIGEISASAATTVATPKISSFENVASGVKISWSKVSGASKYRVFYKSRTGAWKGLGNTSSTSMIDTDVSSGHTYTYTIRCLDSNGNYISDYISSGWKHTFIGTPKVSSISSTVYGVKLSWAKVEGAYQYRIFYKSSSGWKGMANTTSTTYIDDDVRSGNSYTYTVRCLDKDGNFISGYNSDGWKIKFVKPTLSTPKITEFENDNMGINITWKKVEGAYAYRVYVLKDGSWERMTTTRSTTYRDEENLMSQNTYTVRCVDKNGNFESSYDSSGWKYEYFSIPTLTSVSAKSNGVEIKWSDDEGVKFRVYAKSNGSGWTKLGDTYSNSYVHTTAQAGITYTYTVRAIKSDASDFISQYDHKGMTYAYKTTNEYRDNFVAYLIDHKDEWVPDNSFASASFIDIDFDGNPELCVEDYDDNMLEITRHCYKFEDDSLVEVESNLGMYQFGMMFLYNTTTKQNVIHNATDGIANCYDLYYYQLLSEEGSFSSNSYSAIQIYANSTNEEFTYRYPKSPSYSNAGTKLICIDNINANYLSANKNLQNLNLTFQYANLSTWDSKTKNQEKNELLDSFNAFSYDK